MVQQQFQCPKCHSPIIYGAQFCNYCGTPLTWQQQMAPPPIQQQPPYHQQQQEYYWQEQKSPEPRRKNPLLIGLVALIAILLLGGGGIFAFDKLSKGTPSVAPAPAPAPKPTPIPTPTPTPSPTPTAPEAQKSTAIKDMLLKLEEVPKGWLQENINPSGIPEWMMYTDIKKPIGEASVRFIADKTVATEEQTSIGNTIILYEDKQSLLNHLKRIDGFYTYDLDDTVEAINLGDGGVSRIVRDKLGTPKVVDGKPVYPTNMRLSCSIYFQKGTYCVELYYYCPTLINMSDKDLSAFAYNLAKRVEARIPTNN